MVCMPFYYLLDLSSPALIGHYFLDESRSSKDGKGEEGTTSSGIDAPFTWVLTHCKSYGARASFLSRGVGMPKCSPAASLMPRG